MRRCALISTPFALTVVSCVADALEKVESEFLRLSTEKEAVVAKHIAQQGAELERLASKLEGM